MEKAILHTLVDFSDWLNKFFKPSFIDEYRQGRSGAHTIQRYDPLTLDLDNDGLETTAAPDGVLFDHDGDGIAHGSGWIAADDGLLVLDRNGNGIIDTGAELFGDHTDTSADRALNGFAPLIELDENNDDKVDAQATRFSARRWCCAIDDLARLRAVAGKRVKGQRTKGQGVLARRMPT